MQGLRPIISAYTRPRSVVAFIGALQQAFDLGVHVFPVFFGDLRRTGAEKRIAVDGYRLLDNIANDQTCIRTLRSIPYINGICFLIPEIGFGDYIFIPFMADLKGCMAFRSKEFTAIPCIIVFLN